MATEIENDLWWVYFFFKSLIAKNMKQLDFFLDILTMDQLNLIFTVENAEIKRMTFLATTSREMIFFEGSYFNNAL